VSSCISYEIDKLPATSQIQQHAETPSNIIQLLNHKCVIFYVH